MVWVYAGPMPERIVIEPLATAAGFVINGQQSDSRWRELPDILLS